MTTPAGIETFANQPVGTVTSGGSTTSDTAFTVTATDIWPAAQATVVPHTFFRFVDVADTSEIMIATIAPGGSGAGQPWTVTRAAEGTTGVTHAANWTCCQLITAGTLQNFKQASNAATSTVTVSNTTQTAVALFSPPDIGPGVVYDAVAFGTQQRLGGTAPGQITWKFQWGWVSSGSPGTTVGSLVTGTNGPTQVLTTLAAGSSWDCNGTFTFIDSTHAVANINYWWQNGAVVNTELVSLGSSVVISGTGPLALTVTIGGTIGTSQNIIAVAPLIYRAA